MSRAAGVQNEYEAWEESAVNRKSIVGASVAAILVVGYVGASWGLGRAVHAGFDNWEQQLANQKLAMIKVAERKYTPGVFSSVEEVTFEFNREFFDQLMKSGQQEQLDEDEFEFEEDMEEDADEEGSLEDAAWRPAAATLDDAPLRFTVRNEVKHGPLPGFSGVGMGRIETKFVWSPAVRAKLDKFLPGREPLEISTLLGLLGGATSHVSSPAFDFKEEKTTLAWKGFEGDFSVGRNMGSIGCDATAPGLSVYDADGSGAKLETLKLTCDGERAFDALYLGTVNFEIASIEGSAKDGASPMRMQKLQYASEVRADGDFVDVAVKAGVGALEFMQYQLSDIKYHLSLRHLHGPTYAALSRKMQDTAMSSMGGDPTASLALVGAFAEFGPQLLEHSPQIVIDHIGFSTPEGEFGIKGSAQLEGFTKDDLATAQARAGLLGKIVANADVWISEGLLNKDWSAAQETEVSADEPAEDLQAGNAPQNRAEALRQQVAAFEQQGFVTRKDGQLHTHIEFKSGSLTANGKPLR
jgi:uncharacterized protein YdgA (DUF945 family)